MLETLNEQPPDGILGLVAAYRADPRPNKIDLGVGVYKNAEGVTPIMSAVRTAEVQLWEAETTKAYTALAGDPAFLDAMIALVLGSSVPRESVAAVATPGGTGALKQGFELVKMAKPNARFWLSDPTWPNHPSMLAHMGFEMRKYRYFDDESCSVDFEAMMADLAGIGPGDVVLLHGCCHNPTGANLNATQWQSLIAHLQATGATPFIDIAYQGFGDGLEEDAAAVRAVVAALPETIIAASCSKNFGIYRERTGIMMAVSSGDRQTVIQNNLGHLNRQNYSFPPDHGARVVSMILTDDALRRDWTTELEAVRLGMLDLRQSLADALREASGSDRFGFIAEHRGMFSRLGIAPEKVLQLREDHGIYMVGDSRINIAGLNAKTVPVLAEAIVAVGG
jgi:aromatic-amino-acid transaminase